MLLLLKKEKDSQAVAHIHGYIPQEAHSHGL